MAHDRNTHFGKSRKNCHQARLSPREEGWLANAARRWVRADSADQRHALCAKGYCADWPCISCIWAVVSSRPFIKSSTFMHGVSVTFAFAC